MKKKKYTIITIASLLLFFPLGVYFMWAKTHWNTKVKVTISAICAVILFSFMNSSSPANDNGTKGNQQNNAKVVSVTTVPTKIPTLKTPEERLKKIAKDTVGDDQAEARQVNGKWVVFASRMDMDFAEPLAFYGAKQMTQDYMFAVYATKLPIQSAEIVMKSPSNGKYFNAALGNSVASQNPASTWTDNSMGPTNFYNYLKQNTNSSEANDPNDAGTFVDTNME